jgi:hypothetical protein
MAFIGQLETETSAEIEARRKTLVLFKSAGLTGRKHRTARALPRLSGLEPREASNNGSMNLDDIPFEAIFTGGL